MSLQSVNPTEFPGGPPHCPVSCWKEMFLIICPQAQTPCTLLALRSALPLASTSYDPVKLVHGESWFLQTQA